MNICLNKFNDDAFMDYYAIYLEEHGEESVFPAQLREKMARHAIDPEHSIIRGIWQTDTGDVLGYCEVNNVDEPEWEIGIYILERHRFQGVGKVAVPLFLDELSAMRRHSFVAKILPDNLASRRLFEGLGAKQMGTELLTSVISDESIESGGLELVRMMMHGRVAG
ncbi:MAG: GNAT family N-acetyltransferase [Eggerthellaceae bacterium]|nr:GNAT family N-acetyltransferase [Eggerthellaceae bacterium]